jgi:hypothetical protein
LRQSERRFGSLERVEVKAADRFAFGGGVGYASNPGFTTYNTLNVGAGVGFN